MIRIQKDDFDIAHEMALFKEGRSDIGALVSFTGLVRDSSDNQKISKMFLEHYPGMTEKVLQDLEQEAVLKWPLSNCLIIHRVGELVPGDNIVLVMTASMHRQAAFEAATFLMDKLKTSAPFWKKEFYETGAEWVEAKSSDDNLSKRWR